MQWIVANLFDFVPDFKQPITLSGMLGGSLLFVRGYELTLSFFELPLPFKQSRPFGRESVHRCLEAVLFPEYEGFGLVFGFLG